MFFSILLTMGLGAAQEPSSVYTVSYGGLVVAEATGPATGGREQGYPTITLLRVAIPSWIKMVGERHKHKFDLKGPTGLWKDCYLQTFQEGILSTKDNRYEFTLPKFLCTGEVPSQ